MEISHIFMVLSQEDVANLRSSCVKEQAEMTLVWPLNYAQSSSRLTVFFLIIDLIFFLAICAETLLLSKSMCTLNKTTNSRHTPCSIARKPKFDLEAVNIFGVLKSASDDSTSPDTKNFYLKWKETQDILCKFYIILSWTNYDVLGKSFPCSYHVIKLTPVWWYIYWSASQRTLLFCPWRWSQYVCYQGKRHNLSRSSCDGLHKKTCISYPLSFAEVFILIKFTGFERITDKLPEVL